MPISQPPLQYKEYLRQLFNTIRKKLSNDSGTELSQEAFQQLYTDLTHNRKSYELQLEAADLAALQYAHEIKKTTDFRIEVKTSEIKVTSHHGLLKPLIQL